MDIACFKKKSYLCVLNCVIMRKTHAIIFILVCLSFVACHRRPTPKQYAYFRMAIPDTAYVQDSLQDYPYTFKVSKNAEIKPHYFPGENYWIDIVYPSLNATIYCSYKPIKNNLHTLARDAQEFLFSHSRVASAIPTQEYADDTRRMYGIYCELHGDVASPIQFVLTDSIDHFFRASVYCNAVPNQDSLAPIYDYIREDIRVMIESMQWK